MPKAAEPTVKQFVPASGEWPERRGRFPSERTAEEIALRDALFAALSANAAGVDDPDTYADRKAIRAATSRYRSLLASVMPEDKRLETAIIGTDGSPLTLRMRIGVRKPKQAKEATA